ncbi:hypothetical protein BBJ28_00007921 [Nothophytophthora sp. Chile5]|nr:hypothetical protein BBJ28_00007921 [Nothophytophthora sp. Chile5]
MALQAKVAGDAEGSPGLAPPPRAAGSAFERSEALVVSATFLRAAFGGAAAVYALWLGRPCSSVVVVHLLLPDDAACSVKLSSDRLCFTPENFAAPQLVRVDVVENRPLWNVITHRLFSLDRNYDRAHTPTVVVQTEVTSAECPLVTFGGLLAKRKAATTGSPTLTRLDLLVATPDDPNNRPPTDCATASQAQDGACCVSHMASGYNFSVVAVAQPKGNALVAWGLNTNGELGNGTLTSAAAPQPVTLLPMLLQGEPLTVSHVSCGKHHVAVVTGQARLFTWGSNRYGQLGLGDFSSRSQPEEVRFALATLSSHRRALRVKHTVQRGGNNVTHVACGAAHTLFVTHQQQILGMGYNQAGQLGLGHQLQQHKGWRSYTPIVVESLRDQSILDLSAGQNHSACVLSNGDVYTWGCGDDGRLGNGKSDEGATTPTLLKLLREVPIRARAVRCGARHMAVLSDRDLLYVWGANEFGQVGCRDTKPRSHPYLLAPPTLFAEGVADVALGEFHSTCVTLQGKAFAWGLNLRNDVTNIGACASPHIVVLPERERVKKVSCGWTHINMATYVVPDETGASRQETNIDRKREKERLLERKHEAMRWRAVMSATMAPAHRSERRRPKSEQEAGAQTRPNPDMIISAEELYRVDMEQLSASNEKFFEISTSANQHVESIQTQLPSISEAFQQSAIDQFDAAINTNAEEMVALSESHAAEKAELRQAHERAIHEADDLLRDRVMELETKCSKMEETYLDELQQLRQNSASKLQTLQASSRAEKEELERSTALAIETLRSGSKEELEELRTRTRVAYEELGKQSLAEVAELQRSSEAELAEVKDALTKEILTLKTSSAADLTALAEKSEQELQALRKQKEEAFRTLQAEYSTERAQLLEGASEEITRLHMLQSDQATRMEARRCLEVRNLSDDLQATKAEHSNQIQALHQRYTSEFETLKSTAECEKTSLLVAHGAEVEKISLEAASQLSQTTTSYETKLNLMAEMHGAEISRSKEEAAQARDALVTKYEQELAALHDERACERAALILQYETELDASRCASREQRESTAKAHEMQLAQLREAHSAKLLTLEMTMREQSKQAEEMIEGKNVELERRQDRIEGLEASELALKKHHGQYAERSLELVEQKNMALCEREGDIWSLQQANMEKATMLEDVSRELKSAREDLETKGNTILELTFVIKSRDDEIEKLRTALLDTVQTVNTKTEILDLTAETLSSKAKELEDMKTALRLETGRLSRVEESMHQKEGLLENTELKVESMRLNMENMRLEMKRMQMDMKLQLEHTEGEIDLKNGEIRRLYGSQSELKQKNDFCHQTIERLEEELAFSQRQGEEAQRRIALLKLEATQSTDEMKQVCDRLLGSEQDLVLMTREKQAILTESQRVQIQFNNLTQVAQALHQNVERQTMRAEEIQARCHRLLEETSAEKEERMRSEKHLLMLELLAVRESVRHLEGVEERLNDSSQKNEALHVEKRRLENEVQELSNLVEQYKDTDRLLHAAEDDIALKKTRIDDQESALADMKDQLHTHEEGARHRLNASQMEMEDARGKLQAVRWDQVERTRRCARLETDLSSLRLEKEQLLLSLGQEKEERMRCGEMFQEEWASMRAELDRTASDLSDSQHTLELTGLQEELEEQKRQTCKATSDLHAVNKLHGELQTRFSCLNEENQTHMETFRSVEQQLTLRTNECSELQQSLEEQRGQFEQLTADYHSKVALLTADDDSHITQLAVEHCDGMGLLQEEQDSKVVETAVSFPKASDERRAVDQGTGENHRQLLEQEALGQRQAADEQIHAACAHSLELLTVQIAHAQELASMEEKVAEIKLLHSQQTVAIQVRSAQLEVEQTQAREEREQQRQSDAAAANERNEQAIAEQERLLTVASDESNELVRLRLTEEHLVKVNEQLEGFHMEKEQHAVVLATAQEELVAKAKTLESIEGQMEQLTVERSGLQTQLQTMKRRMAEQDVIVAVKNATIDNIRKELNLLHTTSKSTRSSEQFVALLRQQLETHLMEVYHIELGAVADFALDEESDLLECLKGALAMRCRRKVVADNLVDTDGVMLSIQTVRDRLQEYDGVISVVRQCRVSPADEDEGKALSGRVAALAGELDRLRKRVGQLFMHDTGADGDKEDDGTDASMRLLDGVASLFEKLAIPRALDAASVRSQQLIEILQQHDKLMREARSSCVKDEIQSVEDIARLFTSIEAVLTRAREVTGSHHVVKLEDLLGLFDEWENLLKQLDTSKRSSANEMMGVSLDGSPFPAATTPNYLRSAEILASRQEASRFAQRCKDVLHFTAEKDASVDDIVEAIELLMKILRHFELLQPKLGSPRRSPTVAASALPTCGNAVDANASYGSVSEISVPTIESKVAAVLSFVEELQLMSEFAQSILDEDCKSESQPASNENSSASLSTLRALTRTPSPAPAVDDLQIDVDLPFDRVLHDFDQQICEFSNDEGDRQREDFFLAPTGDAPSRSPSPFLADSLMDISLVMNDHHQLLSQTARWVAKSRQSGTRGPTSDLGGEIGRLVREHCALLSLARRLFKLKDPRQELASLLEGVALLEKLTGRLALFSSRNGSRSLPELRSGEGQAGGSSPSESTESLAKSEADSAQSSSLSVFESMGDMARHLQDYDYFLEKVHVDKIRPGGGELASAAVNIEELVDALNERIALAEQSRCLLGLQDPLEELPQVLLGMQEVLRQAKQLRTPSALCEGRQMRIQVENPDGENSGAFAAQQEEDVEAASGGVGAILVEMDAVAEDLQSYHQLVAWMNQTLPFSESTTSVDELQVRVQNVLTQLAQLTTENARLETAMATLESGFGQLEDNKAALVQNSVQEGAVLLELDSLQPQPLARASETTPTRLEVLQALVRNQQLARQDAQQREVDAEMEMAFLRHCGLLPVLTTEEPNGVQETPEAPQKKGVLPVAARINIYNQLLESAERLRAEKSCVELALVEVTQRGDEKLARLETHLAETKREMEAALAEERAFLGSHEAFSSCLGPENPTGAAAPSRMPVFQQLLEEMTRLLEDKRADEGRNVRELDFLRVNELIPESAATAATSSSLSPTRLNVFQQLVDARALQVERSKELELEKRFLLDKSLAFDPRESHSSRLVVYETLLAGQNALIEEKMERELALEDEKAALASLTRKVERLETALMAWQESAVASQREWDDMLLEEEEKRRSLAQRFAESHEQTAEVYARELAELTRARDAAETLAASTHAEALEHATREHEARLAAELDKQARQLEVAAFAQAELASHTRVNGPTDPASQTAMQARAQLLDKFAKRDTAAISMIYRAIRLATDILSATAAPSTGAPTARTPLGSISDKPVEATQAVLTCVQELKALKDYLVQSLEQATRGDDHQPTAPVAQAPFAKWTADAIARATGDKESAIDLALCAHREFMSFAHLQLLTRQEAADKALARLYEKVKAAAAHGAFTAEQQELLALELEVTRQKEAGEDADCKLRLNEEYYRRLLDDRKELEAAQTAAIEGLREESKALRLELAKMEQGLLQQQARPPSGHHPLPASRVLKSAAVSSVPMPMRPERPRGGGSAHKERFVSDLERETGQRHSSPSRRFGEGKARDALPPERSATPSEQELRALLPAAAAAAPATAPGSSLQSQELWYQGVRSLQFVSFFISVFHVPRQQLFRVEVFNSDTEQQQQTVYVTWTEMQTFLRESRKAVRLGIQLPDSEAAAAVPQHVRAEIADVLFERVRVYGEGTDSILLGFE